MNFHIEKIELAKMLLETEDKSLIKAIKILFKAHEKDFWNELPQHVKDGVKKSREQAKNGLLTPHDVVIKKYAKYL